MARYNDCKTQQYINVVTDPQNKTINFRCTNDNWGDYSGRTGRISCPNGFKAEIRLVTPEIGNWNYMCLALVADEIPVDQCIDKLTSFKMDGSQTDPNALVYGMYCDLWRHNLKEKSTTADHLNLKDTVLLTYNK